MSSFGDVVQGELIRLLEPLLSAAGSSERWPLVLGLIGHSAQTAADPGLAAALDDLGRLAAQVVALDPGTLDSWTGVQTVLQTSDTAWQAVHALHGAAHDPAVGALLENLAAELTQQLLAMYLRHYHPRLHRVAAALTLIDPLERRGPNPPVMDGSTLARSAWLSDSLRFDRAGALLTDPWGTLSGTYLPNKMQTPADAHAAASAAFPLLGAALDSVGLGWNSSVRSLLPAPVPDPADTSPDDGGDHDDGDLPADDDPADDQPPPVDLTGYFLFTQPRMTILIPGGQVGTAAAGAGVSLILDASSPQYPDAAAGFVVGLLGTLNWSETHGPWSITLSSTGDLPTFVMGPGGLGRAPTAGAGATAKLSVRHTGGGAAGPAFIFGAADGTRIEIGSLALDGTLDLTVAAAQGQLTIAASSGKLVIDSGDGDSLLAQLLPSGGVSVDFDLGLVISSSRGIELTGGASLDSTRPVHVSLGPVGSIDAIRLALGGVPGGLAAQVTAAVTAHLGPVSLSVDRLGVQATAAFPDGGGNAGPAQLTVGFAGPTGVGVAIDTAGLTGGGFLSHNEAASQYAGMLQLSYQAFQLQAFGLIATKLPTGSGYSMVAMIDATFPPIQLVAGFTLNGVGGLLGINRTVSTDALAAGIKAKTLSTFLFTKNPIANAAQLLTDLATFFPAAPGRYVFGPLLQIGWGTPTAITIDLALVLELPDPVRLVLIGELTVLLPNPNAALLEMHMDVLGTVDFGTDEGSLDAVLHDSRLVQYPLQGSMALRSCWSGSDKTFLLSVGGFHPKFQPPAGFPALQRVSISMPSGPLSKLNLDGYFAISSNTLQLGARIDLFYGADGFGIAGNLNFDTLIERNPFYFDGDISGGVTLSVDGDGVMSVDLSADLTGPAPWHCAGKVHFSVLGFGVTKHFSHTFGSSAPAQATDVIDIGAQVRAALSDPRNFTATLTANQNGLVSLLTPVTQGVAVGHPAAGLKVLQRVVPLGLTIQKFGAGAPSGDTQFTITAVTADGAGESTTPVQDEFAPAQFLNMSDDDKLASPSFEPFDAGISLADGALTFGNAGSSAISAIVHPFSYETYLVDTPGGDPREDTGLPVPPDRFSGILWGLFNSGRLRYAAPSQPMVHAAKLEYVVATTDQIAASGVGVAAGQTYAQAHATLREAITSDPPQSGALQVVPLYEVTHG